jgi:hypothetical protein
MYTITFVSLKSLLHSTFLTGFFPSAIFFMLESLNDRSILQL